MRIRQIVFDLDGTLLDTAPDIANAANRALVQAGFAELEQAKIRRLVGNGAQRLIERCLQALGAPESRTAEIAADFVAHYQAQPSAQSQPYPGMAELLSTLQAKGFRLDVLTNKPQLLAQRVLEDSGLAGAFEQIVGARELLPLKPDPKGLKSLLAASSFRSWEAVLVGDSVVDLRTARAAGIAFVGAGWGFEGTTRLRQAGAERVAEQPVGVLALVAGA